MNDGTFPTPVRPARIPMAIARWKGGKLHVTRDGIKTACGALIPHTATRTAATLDWYLHTTCYNCAFRLWPGQGPDDYVCPRNSSDFPPQRRRPHGGLSSDGARSTPRAMQDRPPPTSSTTATGRHPRATSTEWEVFPPFKLPDPERRCPDGCESIESVERRANPDVYLNLADSAMARCYRCGNNVCVACQTAPVDGTMKICDQCSEDADG